MDSGESNSVHFPTIHLTTSQFMMDFELKLEKPRRREAYISAAVMGLAYFIGKQKQIVFSVFTNGSLQADCYQ